VTRRPDSRNPSAPCPWSEELAAYLQEELDPDRSLAVLDHLEGCSACQVERDDLRRLLGDLVHLETPSPSRADLVDRVLRTVAVAVFSPFRHLGPGGTAFLGMAAATVLLLLFVHVPKARSPAGVRGGVVRASTEKGWRWLLSVQEEDGSWSPERWGGRPRYRIGLTGLATSAIAVAAGEGRDVERSLDRSVAFLLRQQDASGRLGEPTHDSLYNHALASFALLRVRSRHPISGLDAPCIRAVEHVMREQRSSGGWGYGDGSGLENAIISAWPLEVLCLARDAGLLDVEAAIVAARGFLSRLRDERGHLGYESVGSYPYGKDTSTAVGLRFLGDTLPGVPVSSPGDCDLLALYFFAASARPGIRQIIAQRMAAIQVRKGVLAGSFRPADRWGSEGGRIYSTSVALLALQNCIHR